MTDELTAPSALSLRQLLKFMVDRGGSDLHITAGAPPQFRVDGQLLPARSTALTPQQTKLLCYESLTEEQRGRFEREKELDFSFGIRGMSRFRGNISQQRGSISGAFRKIPYEIRTLTELGAPVVVSELCEKPRGMVLITGPTGSGKSTTLAAMIDKINREHTAHIITVEDPIEYLHSNKSSIVNQREVGTDTLSFAQALKHVLRQDPNVVMVGEMRDLETIQTAITISETGHLVLATLHTNTAVQSINRIIDVFPPHQQKQVRIQLSFVLEGVVSQILLPRIDGPGRCMACEVLVPNAAVRSLIRDEKTRQIYGIMQTGQQTSHMKTMNQSLVELVAKGAISNDIAYRRSPEPNEIREMLTRVSAGRT